MTVGKQFEKNFAMICFLLSPSGGKRKTHFSLQNSERPFCLPTVTHSPPVSAIMALNIMYRQKKTDGNRPRLPSVSVAFLCILHNPLFMIRVVGLCNMLKLTIFQRKSQNIIDIYNFDYIFIFYLSFPCFPCVADQYSPLNAFTVYTENSPQQNNICPESFS